MKNSMLTPVRAAPAKKKAPPKDVTPKDNAFDRTFTKKGTPRLSAQSGEGSMGQRR